MKVFIYSKKTSKKLITITDVIMVQILPHDKKIQIVVDSGEIFEYDTTQVKTTIYQN